MNKHKQQRNTGGKLGMVVEQRGREFKATISTFSNKIQRSIKTGRCPAYFIRDYRLRQGTNKTEILHDKYCQGHRMANSSSLAPSKYVLSTWLSSLVPTGTKKTHTHRENCCRHCFRFSYNPELRASPDALQDKLWYIQKVECCSMRRANRSSHEPTEEIQMPMTT